MKRIKNKMLLLGLNPKNELKNLIIINLVLLILCVAIYFFSKSLMYSLFGLISLPIFSFLYFYRYDSKIDSLQTQNTEEFTNLFSYFRIFIHNGYSVYSALKEIQNYANESLKKMLQILLDEIDEDKSIQPFITFAKNFNEIIIEEMMISIYQMIDDGENSDYLIQFEIIFDKFSELMYQKNLRRKDSRLGTLSSAPLIGSCYLMIVLTIGIVGVIGVMVSGI